MPFFIILLGPPGAGKGTQAEIVSKNFGLAHVSSGDLFRENIKASTALGIQAKQFIESGALVPDAITIEMVRNRLLKEDCGKGVLLDGFPRTVEQAKALASMLTDFNAKINKVLYIAVPEEILVERLSGRVTCKAQGHVYHEFHHPPKVPGICDIDGSELFQRPDDKAATVKNRINVYFDQTIPLVEYYRREGSLSEIDGTLAIEDVTRIIEKTIKEAGA